ncbi:hypothetical protein B0H10DRAFT_1956750 [Mycena sp. CBHHK59/15]|nr:hypothetical protein B0H10DRAFT_1956750 [Mycena sp. CBHHK59/15]
MSRTVRVGMVELAHLLGNSLKLYTGNVVVKNCDHRPLGLIRAQDQTAGQISPPTPVTKQRKRWPLSWVRMNTNRDVAAVDAVQTCREATVTVTMRSVALLTGHGHGEWVFGLENWPSIAFFGNGPRVSGRRRRKSIAEAKLRRPRTRRGGISRTKRASPDGCMIRETAARERAFFSAGSITDDSRCEGRRTFRDCIETGFSVESVVDGTEMAFSG